tara:strand:- start:125 stop:931 length:807 start_codon:yes stop_codon:yes gene_type:complete
MLGNYFYHKIIRKTVTTFGTLFNNIQLKTLDADGDLILDQKVPLAYGPVQKFLARLQQSPNLDKKVTITVPRMSFEMTGINYDAGRKVPPIQKNRKVGDGQTTTTNVQYLPVPYNIGFELNVIAKSQDDALQILEQILPFFQPNFTMTVNLIPEMDEKRDLPIILESIDFTDDYEGDYSTRRFIYYTLRFTVKTYMYGPVAANDIIRKSIATTLIGDRNTNQRALEYNVTPKALEDKNNDGTINAADDALLQPDDDFGFNEGIIYHGQ